VIKVEINGTQVNTECAGKAEVVVAELAAVVRGVVRLLLANNAPIAPMSLLGRTLNDIIHEEIGRASFEGITKPTTDEERDDTTDG